MGNRRFAEQVVEVYAARIALNLPAQGDLERAILARIGADESSWVATANAVLAEWDRERNVRGPRVAMTGGGRVVEKRLYG